MPRRQRLDGNLSREALVTFDAVFDHDPAHPRFEQRAHREPAAPIGQGDDNAIGAQVGDDLAQPSERAGQTRGFQDVALVEVVDDAGQTLPPAPPPANFSTSWRASSLVPTISTRSADLRRRITLNHTSSSTTSAQRS